MTFLQELKTFVKHILHWVYALVVFAFFFFLLGPEETTIFGYDLVLPLPTKDSFSAQIFNLIRGDLLPPGVELVVTNPMSAFASQILFSLLLSFLLTIPFFIYKIVLYIKPALLPHERKAVILSSFPFAFLFLAGCAFSYFFLIPATFEVLYPYATAIGATPFFTIDEFVYYVSGLMIAVGLMFLLPLFMFSLSFIGVIRPKFWKEKWRYALLLFLVLSAIITPDGSGVTMILLFLPLMILYVAGYFFARELDKSARDDERGRI